MKKSSKPAAAAAPVLSVVPFQPAALRKGEDEAAKILTEQWKRAAIGLREIVAFGAMMVQLEEGFSGLKRTGSGLKGWLAKHCPEINYKTAMGYKAEAMGLRRLCKLAEDRPLLPLMGESPLSDEEEEEARELVASTIAESSLRLLRDAASAQETRGGARDGAGRKKLVADGQSLGEAALVQWTAVQSRIVTFCGHSFDKYLAPEVAAMALQSVTQLRDLLAARVEEGRAERRRGAAKAAAGVTAEEAVQILAPEAEEAQEAEEAVS